MVLRIIKNRLFITMVTPFAFFIPLLAQEKAFDIHRVTFYFVRHGETVLNRLQRVQGWSDAPLTPGGKEVAYLLGIGLKDTSFVKVYSSDLGRAIETAETILENRPGLRNKIEKDKSLRESGFGSYEGKLGLRMWNDVALYMHFKSIGELMRSMQEGNKISDVLASIKALDTLRLAEDFEQVEERMSSWLTKTADEVCKNGGGNILVVSHGIAIGTLLNFVLGPSYKTKQLGNASVTLIEYDGSEFKVITVGDMRYVQDGRVTK